MSSLDSNIEAFASELIFIVESKEKALFKNVGKRLRSIVTGNTATKKNSEVSMSVIFDKLRLSLEVQGYSMSSVSTCSSSGVYVYIHKNKTPEPVQVYDVLSRSPSKYKYPFMLTSEEDLAYAKLTVGHVRS
jgi:hypothetical protein